MNSGVKGSRGPMIRPDACGSAPGLYGGWNYAGDFLALAEGANGTKHSSRF